jgi:DNA end-binding protein Ku
MHFNDEVVRRWHVAGVEVKAKVDDRELKMATQLIDSLSTDFKPRKYNDEYREQVMEIIERKAAGEEIHTAPTREEKGAGRATNLMAALEASLAKSRNRRRQQRRNQRSRPRPAAKPARRPTATRHHPAP